LRDNGTFLAKITEGTRTISRSVGKWSLSENFLISEYILDDSGVIDAGCIDRDALLEVTNDHFLLRTTGGIQRRYKRVADSEAIAR